VLIALFLLLVIVFSIPSVQTYSAKKIVSFVNDKYETLIDVEGMGIGFTGQINLDKVLIKDHKNDTLIWVNRASTSIVNLNELIKGYGKFSDATLDGAFVNMKIYKGEDLDNMQTFARKFIKKRQGKKKKVILEFDQVTLRNSRYMFTNFNTRETPIVDFKKINFRGDELYINGHNVKLNSNQLSFNYNNGIDVTNLKTRMFLDKGVMNFEKIELTSKNDSKVEGYLNFIYGEGDLRDFNNKVIMNAQVKPSVVSLLDLKTFYHEFGTKGFIYAKSSLNGTINNLSLNNVDARGINNSIVKGDILLKNSLSKNRLKDFKASSNYVNITTTTQDLEMLLPNLLKGKFPDYISKFGSLNFKGKSEATPFSVKANGSFYSNVVHGKWKFFIDDFLNYDGVDYDFNLKDTHVDLGVLLSKPELGLLSGDFDIKGVGFYKDNINNEFNCLIKQLDLKKYSYSNIELNGLFQSSVMESLIVSNDPNINLEANGVFDFMFEEKQLTLSSKIAHLDFNKINLFKRDSLSVFKGDVYTNLKGSNFDNIIGDIKFKNTSYTNQNDVYSFKDFDIISTYNANQERKIWINSPEIIQGSAQGKFSFKSLPSMFKNSVKSLYTQSLDVLQKQEYIDFDFKIYDKIVEVFYPNTSFGSGSFIKGYLSHDISKFKLDAKSPFFQIDDNIIEGLDVRIDNSKFLTKNRLSIGKLKNKFYELSDIKMSNLTVNDTLFINTNFRGNKNKRDYFEFNLYHYLNKDTTSVVGFTNSLATINDKEWKLSTSDNTKNIARFYNKFNSIDLSPIVFQHDNQKVVFSGAQKNRLNKKFEIEFDDVDLSDIVYPIDSLKVNGNIHAKLVLNQEQGVYKPYANIDIEDLQFNDFNYGNLQTKLLVNESFTKYDITTSLTKDNKNSLELMGAIFKDDEDYKLNLKSFFNKYNIAPFSPLGGIVFNNLRGEANGLVLINGSLFDPKFTGDIRLKNSGLNIPYLNVDLALKQDSKLSLDKNKLIFNQTKFSDTKYNTNGQLDGSISHIDFKKWILDLHFDTDRLLVLDTKEGDNELYYGTAFMNGSAHISGPTDEVLINVIGESSPGTEFKIPLTDTETIGDNSFVHFISPEEKLAKEKGEQVYFDDVKGVELQFELDLNQYANVEIVVDQESGSSLKGNGAGTLLIEINTNGKFNMWGDFVAYNGIYDFRYGGLLSKRFDVLSGGSINWNGSPTGALLNLSAVYNTQANPAIILEDATFNRNLDVQVVTTLQGELLKPDLAFDIEFPNVGSVVKSELDYVLSDTTVKERQAISLVTQGQFYSDTLIDDTVITGNLVERASSLVNSIFSDEDDKFQVGLDYVQGAITDEQEISDRFGVSVTTQINDRILINGKVGVPVGGVSESVVVGDVRIDFLLNEDGTLRANIFNRQNDIQFIGETDGYTQGVGLSYSYDFDTFKDILRKIFNSKSNK